MTSTGYFIAIVTIIIVDFILGKRLSYLNAKSWKPELPEELKSYYDPAKYSKAQHYHKAQTKVRFNYLFS